MPGSWVDWLKRRRKNSLRLTARALLGVEQLEKREVRSVVYWTGDAGTTHWNDAGNWSTVDPLKSNVPSQVLPGPTDAVVIDLQGVTVDHSAASQDVIGSLQVTAVNVTLNLSNGTLDLSGVGGSGTFQIDQSGDVVNLQGGTLKDATVTSGTTIVANNSGIPNFSVKQAGTLDGVTLNGTLEQLNGASTTIRSGLVLNGTIDVGGGFSISPSGFVGSELTFDDSNGPQTLSTIGQGQIDFSQGVGSLKVSGDTLTIMAGITIHGGATLDPAFPAQDFMTGLIDNFGKIDEDSGGIIAINDDQGPGSLHSWQGPGSLVPWTNNGTIEVSNGTITLGGPWTNNGTITAGSGTNLFLGDDWVTGSQAPNLNGDAWVNNGTINTGGTGVYLGGNLTQVPTNLNLTALGLGKDSVSIIGILDNSSQTLTLTPGVTSINGWWTVYGQIDGGTIDETAAQILLQGSGTLNGVKLINPPPNPGGPSVESSPARPLDPIQVMGPNGRYVDLLYERLLGRAADVQGGTSFVAALDSGRATQGEVIEEICHSQEYLTREVTLLYQIDLGRAPDSDGLATSVALLAAGGSSTQLEAIQLGSPEYFSNVGGTNAAFVSAVYQAVLGRAPDSLGAQNFAQKLAAGVSRATVAQQILASPEAASREVQQSYELILNRAADSAGLAVGSTLMENGGNPQQMIAKLATSSEFAAVVNADVGQLFVTRVYQALLGRAPDPAALAIDGGAIDAGTATRLQIVEEIQSSTEYQTDAVDALYQEVLGRAPDPGGLAGSLAILAQGGTLTQLEGILLSSSEFFNIKGGGNNSGFLSALYQVALNRVADSGGAQAFGQVLAGGVLRTAVVADVLLSPESQTLAIEGLYGSCLGRSADPGGLSSALADMQNGASREQIAAIMMASPEYMHRL